MARGIERGLLFRDDSDKEDLIRRLSELCEKQAWSVYAWALMSNHFHLLVRSVRNPLSQNMRSLMSGYAGYFNRRHRRHGHLFQNRYKSIVCEEETYFLELVRYLHLNPVRSGIVKDLNELDEYKYSGHSAIVGIAKRKWQNTEEVLVRFADKRRQSIHRYREFVATGFQQGRRPELEGGGLLRSNGGWMGVKELRRGREKYRSDERVLGSSSFIEEVLREVDKREEVKNKGVNLPVLMGRIASEMGISAESITGSGRSRKISRARAVLAYVWIRYLGRSGYELAKCLRKSPQSLYILANRIAGDNMIVTYNLERWCF
jgi:putative transposase